MAATIRSTSFNVAQYVHPPVLPRKNINIMRISHLNPRNSGFVSFGLTNRSIRTNCEGVNGGARIAESPCIGSEKGEGVNGGASVGESQRIGSEKGKVLDEDYDLHLCKCMQGELVQGENVYYYRQAFIIRSYDTGPDQKLTMEGVMNLLQEMNLNFMIRSGLGGNEFGATRAMIDKKLTWVVSRVHVEVYKYSSRGDVVEIDTWVDELGPCTIRKDWIIRNYTTQETIGRGTSKWATMNRETRKTPNAADAVMVKKDFKPLFYKNPHALEVTAQNIPQLKTADNVKRDLAPRWTDIDANQHVNSVKYIGLILESVPKDVLQGFNMTSITLRYKKECKLGDVFESGTTMEETIPPPTSITTIGADTDKLGDALVGTHCLRLQDDDEGFVLAGTKWHRKSS